MFINTLPRRVYRMVDGKMQYETHPLTEDGWYEVCSYSEIVPLLDEQGVRISQADFIQGLKTPGI
jgi:hypothetical protein